MLALEKRTISDAVHELRTPHAAIRSHTTLAKNAKNMKQQSESLNEIIQGADRATHVIEQLLTLARLDTELLEKYFSEVDLTTLLIENYSSLSPLAINKDIDMPFQDKQSSSKGK